MKIVRGRYGRRWHDAGADVGGFYRRDAPLVLQNSVHDQVRVAEHRHSQALENIGLQYDVGNSRFVFDTQKHKTLRSARLLAADDGSGYPYESAVGHVFYLRGGDDLHAVQSLAVE